MSIKACIQSVLHKKFAYYAGIMIDLGAAFKNIITHNYNYYIYKYTLITYVYVYTNCIDNFESIIPSSQLPHFITSTVDITCVP